MGAAVDQFFIISGFLLLFWMWGHYKKHFLEVYRADLFRIRDELFIYAADGKSSFGALEYNYMRDRLNTALRYAHRMGISRIIIFLFFEPNAREMVEKETRYFEQEILKPLDEEQRAFFDKIHTESGIVMAKYMLCKSPLFFIPFCIYLSYKMRSFDIRANQNKFGNDMISGYKLQAKELANNKLLSNPAVT
ncbi:MAG: hypothetical protein WC552_09520 [Candidatus Omnitrophota bacterium]